MKVNLGSGPIRHEGFVNIDASPHVNPDIVCNIEKGISLEDDSVDEIKAHMILEHVSDIIHVMNEIWRVLKPDGKIEIIVPHETSAMAWGDPTHKRVFNEESFGYFCSKWHGGLNGKSNHYRVHKEYGIKCNFEMIEQRVSLDRRSGNIYVVLRAIK